MELEAALRLVQNEGYHVFKPQGPDAIQYGPYVNQWQIYQPWLHDPDIEHVVKNMQARGMHSLVNRDRLLIIKNCVLNLLAIEGEIWEAGVYQGGSASLICHLLRKSLAECNVRLFDTFEGMPETDPENDLHKKGDFNDTSLEKVVSLVGRDHFISYYKGLVPETFSNLGGSSIKLAHIDLDIYKPILSSCEFIWPRLIRGGIMIFDDYGFSTCPGARKAVDEYFNDCNIQPIVLPTGSAIVYKG